MYILRTTINIIDEKYIPNSKKYIFISGSSVIVWKQTERIISAGEHLLRKDSRMTLIKSPNGINLQIANVTPDDRGK